MSTQEMRDTFQISNLFVRARSRATSPILTPVCRRIMRVQPRWKLPNHKETAAPFFSNAVELGAINVGGPGRITADAESFALDKLDCVYLPMA